MVSESSSRSLLVGKEISSHFSSENLSEMGAIPKKFSYMGVAADSLFATQEERQGSASRFDFSEEYRWKIACDLAAATSFVLSKAARSLINPLGKVEVILSAMASRFLTCREKFLLFECLDCGNTDLVPGSCNVRFCPRCNSKRYRSLQDKFGGSMRRMRYPMFISISVPNFDSLSKETLSLLRSWLSKLRRRKSFRSVRGGFYDFDVTFSYESGWNLHIHSVIDCVWLDRDKVMSDWLEITSELGGSTRNVFIERAYVVVSKNGVKSKLYWTSNARPGIKKKILRSCSNYLIGHATKAPEVPTPHHLADYLVAAYHSRLVQGFGSMFKLKLTPYRKECSVCESTRWGFIGGLDHLERSVRSMRGLEISDFKSAVGSAAAPLSVSPSVTLDLFM